MTGINESEKWIYINASAGTHVFSPRRNNTHPGENWNSLLGSYFCLKIAFVSQKSHCMGKRPFLPPRIFIFYLFFLNLFFIGGQCLYSVVLVSAIHHRESAVGTHLSLLPEPPLPPTPLLRISTSSTLPPGWVHCVCTVPPESQHFSFPHL